MRPMLPFARRASTAQIAALLALAATLGGPGCGCGDDSGLTSCGCGEAFVFASAPPAPLTPIPANVTLVNLQQDPGDGSIGFGPTISTFPSVFMAASTRGTIVRIDVNTGVILGEYRTSPQTRALLSPSRTTVDKFGECWVGNRSNINDTDPVHPGSVTRIGIVAGGTRFQRSGPIGGPYTYVASPTGEFLQGPFTYVSPSVVDRDADGYIRTSYGLPNTSILGWDPALTGGNDLGGVTLAEDECIVNFTRVVASGTRGLAIDCDNDLWVGGTGNPLWQEVNGGTGIAGIIRNVGPAYGGAIDGNEVLWSVDNGPGQRLWQHDIAANSTTFTAASGLYGITIAPCDSNIWTSGSQLRHWNPAGAIVGAFPWPGFFGHGLSVDQIGDVWVAGGNFGVRRYSSSGTLLGTVSTGIVFAKGTAVDQNGKIWVADLLGDNAVRIDPTGPAVDLTVPMGAGAGPYNYSDMTGLAALSSCGETGFLVATHDARCAGSAWGRITWQSTGTTPDCTVTTEARASDDPLNYPTTWTPVASGTSFCGAPPILGRYVQARVTIVRPPGCPATCDPRLTSLRIECCDARGVGRPPNVTISGPQTVLAPMGPTESIVVSGVVTDPDGGSLEARWAVDGVDAGPAVLGPNGSTSLTRDFPDGISEVTLTASDGQNVTIAKTTVTIGDHVPPAVTCPESPPVVSGEIVVVAFQTSIPDLAAGTSATDNATPSPSLVVTQSPPAGTAVQYGAHPIVVSVTDQAGNVGTCRVLLRVDGVVVVAGMAKYQIFAPGSPIPVSATYRVPAAEIVQTTILVDGVVHSTVPGVLMGSIDISPLPVGSHDVQLVVTNLAATISRSDPVPFDVK